MLENIAAATGHEAEDPAMPTVTPKGLETSAVRTVKLYPAKERSG